MEGVESQRWPNFFLLPSFSKRGVHSSRCFAERISPPSSLVGVKEHFDFLLTSPVAEWGGSCSISQGGMEQWVAQEARKRRGWRWESHALQRKRWKE